MNGQIMSRRYNLDVEDPIEIIADYQIDQTEVVLSPQHQSHHEGITITAHGCNGCVWLSWEDLPKLITGLQQALEERP